MDIYGYIRVSSKYQNEDRQLAAMHAFGIDDGHLYSDHQSGKDFKRTGYQTLLQKLKQGDTLVIKSIDRLGRNYNEILEQWQYLTKKKRTAIVVLDMPLLDTRQDRDLTGTLIADIVLQLLSYVAQTERDFIRQRQAEGIAAARERGVVFGRKPIAVPPSFDDVCRRWQNKTLNSRQASKELGVSQYTFLKWTHLSCDSSEHMQKAK